MLPWQQAKYSSGAPDKGTQDKCDALHLSNSNSLVLLLRQNMLSLWGLLTHICGCAGKKVKDCTHRVPPTHTQTRKNTQEESNITWSGIHIYSPPTLIPPPSFKENMAEVSECQWARICLTFPKCHGIWASCTNEEQGEVEAGRERTWVKHGR